MIHLTSVILLKHLKHLLKLFEFLTDTDCKLKKQNVNSLENSCNNFDGILSSGEGIHPLPNKLRNCETLLVPKMYKRSGKCWFSLAITQNPYLSQCYLV